jgi:large subunit ribosomal protein L32
MAVPKRKTTPSRRGMRRAHDGLKAMAFGECSNCGELHRPHHVCHHCGYYNGKQVLVPKETTAALQDAA